MRNVTDKREREKRMVSEMIALYCNFHHPVWAICHVIETKKEKKRLEKEA